MATITWTGAAGDGNYNNAANWSPMQVPGATDSAVINTPSPTTVSTGTDTLQALTLNKNVTLAVSTGTSLTVGTAGASTTISNAGIISLNSTYYDCDLIIGGSKVTLSGGGTVLMGNGNDNNRIVAATAGDQLVNVNNIIAGAGQIGAGGALAFTNQAAGTVDANASNQLIINTGTVTAINAGLFEATAGGGGLVLQTAVNDGTTGRIAASGAEVLLNGATIQGGTLSSTAGYSVEVVSNSALDGIASRVTNAGSLVIATGETLSVLGTLNNIGILSLQSSYYDSDLIVGPGGSTPGTVTLTGGGLVVMGDANASNRIYGAIAGDTLVNLNNTISGSGTIGAGQLNLVNDGTISATGTANALFLQTNSLLNNGLIEAAGSAGLVVQSVISNAGGTVASAGGTVQLSNGTIAGGVLASSAGGSFAVVNSGTLDGSAQAVTNLGTVEVNTGCTLTALGTLTNDAVIGLNSTYYDSDFVVGSPTLTLNGGGTIVMSDSNTSDRIYGAIGTDTLDNINNTIEGSGQIGAGQLTLINEKSGIIDSTGTQGLTISTDSVVTNNGLIKSTGAGGLAIASTVNSSGGGTILAAASNIYLNAADLQGGLLSSTGTGAFVGNGQTTLDGSTDTVTNTGAIEVSTGDTMTLFGTITNDGTIGLNSTYYNSDLIVGSPTVTLNGAGTIVLSDSNTADRIYGAAGTDILINVNNTIEGSGQVGAGQLTLINERAGIIDSTGAQGLTLSTGSTVINDGLIEATGTGGLAIASAVDDSGGGTILAASSNIYLNGADMIGGLLKSTGTGQFIGNGQTTLDGSAHTVTNGGTIEVSTGDTMTVLGTITNQGTIGLNSTYYNSDLIIASPTLTLNGGGTVALSDSNTADRIYGQMASDVLDNINNTIAGAGQIGAGQLTLVNAGTISATGSNTLVVNLGSTGTNTASGQMLGVGTGGLVFQNGTYTNAGLIQADSGSAVTFQNGAVLTNDSAAGTLTGGTYGAVSAGGTITAAASFTGVAVVSDAAHLVLSGAGSTLSFGGTAIETSLKTIARTGSVSVLGGRSYTTTNTLLNSGTLSLGGGLFTDRTLTDTATATLSGFGTLAGNFKDSGAIVATSGTLQLKGLVNSIAGAVGGSGTLSLSHGTTTLGTGTTLGVSAIALINAATLNIAAPVSFGGTFDMVGKETVGGPGTFTNTGLFEQTGAGLAAISAPFANAGTVSVSSAGSMAFSGGLANTGTILDSGVFTDTAALTGGSLSVGAAASASLATTGSAPSTLATLTTAGTLNLNGTLTVTGDYNNTAAGRGNSYTPFAGVSGTVDGQGTQLAVVGVSGTAITTVNGTLTIALAAGGTAHFEIENTGAAGSAALRGALQTTVNGGSISGTALSGTGVTANNFGPVAAGGASAIYAIHYSGGALTGEAIHLASDFANVAGLTIDIVAQGQVPHSQPVLAAGHPDAAHEWLGWLPGLHHIQG